MQDVAEAGDNRRRGGQHEANGKLIMSGDDAFEMRSGGIKMEINLDLPQEPPNFAAKTPPEAQLPQPTHFPVHHIMPQVQHPHEPAPLPSHGHE